MFTLGATAKTINFGISTSIAPTFGATLFTGVPTTAAISKPVEKIVVSPFLSAPPLNSNPPPFGNPAPQFGGPSLIGGSQQFGGPTNSFGGQ